MERNVCIRLMIVLHAIIIVGIVILIYIGVS